jgi:NADPH2:quinone reductase
VKAVLVEAFGPLDTHAVTEASDPAPTPGTVVIDVHAADTSYADILVIEGAYQVKPPLPFSPGKSAAGTVRAIGDGVTQVAPGDRVLAQVEYGAYAEQLLAREDEVFAIPPTIGFETAAALGLAYQTAYFALVHRGRFSAGERVLVLGASGGVGVAAIQLAKALGAGSVIAAVRAEPDAPIARRAGADTVVLIDRADLKDALREEVFATTAGRGADIVIDPVGRAAGGRMAGPARHRRLRRRADSHDSRQLSPGEEYRGVGPAMVRLLRARAGPDPRCAGGNLPPRQ